MKTFLMPSGTVWATKKESWVERASLRESSNFPFPLEIWLSSSLQTTEMFSSHLSALKGNRI